MRTRYLLVVLAVAVASLAACGGGGGSSATPAGSTSAAGNPEAGKALFAQQTIGSVPGCVTCHSLDGSKLVGPSMQGIGTRAGSEVQGQSAEQFIHTSIVDPNAHITEGYTAGVMPSFKDALSDAQINDLVAYLLTLK